MAISGSAQEANVFSLRLVQYTLASIIPGNLFIKLFLFIFIYLV